MTVQIPDNNLEKTLPQEKNEQTIQQEKPNTQNIEQNTIQEDTKEDPNWKAFREARKKDRIEREAAEKRAIEEKERAEAFKAALEAISNKPVSNNQQMNNAYSQETEETEDQRIDRRVDAKIAQREAAAEKARIEREARELPYRLKQAFPDYDQVVNEENGVYLEYNHPEIYRALLRQGDSFDALSDTYKTVKKLIPNLANAKKEAARADNNFSKPKSISSTGLTQTGEARASAILSQEKKDANYARMQKTINSIG